MNSSDCFALWITGLPASGKSTIARILAARLRDRGLPVVVLESDSMRTILTPHPVYTDEERDRFYHGLALIGRLIAGNGVNVIFDATANRRAYRDRARRLFARFAEIHVATPLSVCMTRDPKRIYSSAGRTPDGSVPGIQAVYEAPLAPEMVVDGRDSPELAASAIVEKLKSLFPI